MSGNGILKRKSSRDSSVSPPPFRRKIQLQSSTTKTAVATFFTPASQKAPDQTVWQERGRGDEAPRTLLIGEYVPNGDVKKSDCSGERRRIAAFDFDSTLIQTTSGKVFATDQNDWRWWHPTVPAILRKLYFTDGYRVVVISNQAGLALKTDSKASKTAPARLTAFKRKVASVFTHLDIPISIYAATEKDIYRKPRTGMWHELLGDMNLIESGVIEKEKSFFVGDAGGRTACAGHGKDFSCSDRNFAHNVGIAFHTPEEYFLEQAPRPFARRFEPLSFMTSLSKGRTALSITRQNAQDIVLFCGSPGSGKSTTFWTSLQPLGYQRVNQDLLKTRDRCLKAADEYLASGLSVVVDNTNADTDVRKKWIDLARKHEVPIRCILFTASALVCEHNDAVRALNVVMNPEKRTLLPGQAFTGFASRFRRPMLEEGFQDIVEVDFEFRGSEAERAIWTQYWV